MAVLLCLLFSIKAGIAQQIDNLTLRQEGTNIEIAYDLQGLAILVGGGGNGELQKETIVSPFVTRLKL